MHAVVEAFGHIQRGRILREFPSQRVNGRGASKMWQSLRRQRLAFSATTVLITTFLLSGCASDVMNTPVWGKIPTDPKESRDAAAQLPPNYRQLMADYIRAHNEYLIRDARITPPYQRYGGLFRGGSIPAVCIAIYRDNPLGMPVRDNRVLTVESGQIHEIRLGTEPCTDLSPFTELKQSSQ